jgi:hypothetical protein
MKKYTHKSGHYIAKEDMYGNYNITSLKRNSSDMDRDIVSLLPFIAADWLKNSNDWVEMVEMPLGEYFSRDEIISAAGMAKFSVMSSIHMQFPIKPGHIIDAFVAKLSMYLPKK